MAGRGKKYKAAKAKIGTGAKLTLEQAVKLLPEVSFAKFNGTVQLSFRLGVDPAKADQMVRGAVVLPHGLGKAVRVLVFAKGEKEKEAREAGADFVGADDMLEKVKEGWTDFDTVIATPDMMGSVGKIGKVLGPRGLMPNPKSGTVTFDIGKAVREAKAGKVEYRVDKSGNLHVPVGRVQFEEAKLVENARAIIDAVVKAKPASSKGVYVKTLTLASAMSPGIALDTSGMGGAAA